MAGNKKISVDMDPIEIEFDESFEHFTKNTKDKASVTTMSHFIRHLILNYHKIEVKGSEDE